jgi:hypothetical protein
MPNVIITPTPACAPLLSPVYDIFVAELVGDVPVVEGFVVEGPVSCDVVDGTASEDTAPGVEVEDAKFHPFSWTAAILVAESAEYVVVTQLFESSWTA